MSQRDWSFLLPWLEALAPWLEFRVWPDVEKPTLRSRLRALRVYLSKPEEIHETEQQTSARLVKVREAIELLGLALHYDRSAWGLFELLAKAPAEYKHWTHFTDASDLEPRFELAFDVSHEDQVFEHVFWRVEEADVFAWDMALCERMLGLQISQMSGTFRVARRMLAEMVGEQFDPAFRLELQFVFMPPRQPSSSYIAELHQFIRRVHDARSPCRQVFRLSLMHAYLHALPYSREMADFFEFIEDSDIHLAMAGIGARTEHCNEDEMLRVVHTTVSAREEKTYPMHREDRLMIVHKADLSLFRAICQELSTGTRIDHLVLEDAFSSTFKDDHGGKTEKTKWELIGRVLATSQNCQRPLKGLTLAAMMSITAANVKQLIAGMGAAERDVTQHLCQNGVQGELRVRLAPNSKLRLPDGNLSTLDMPSSGLRVLNDQGSDGSIMVDLPGVGECVVKCGDIVDSFTSSDGLSRPRPILETLEIGCGYCKADAFLRLTECLGSSLRYIHIHVHSGPKLSEQDWKAIFESCPRLEMLSTTNVSIPTLDVFVDAYTQNQCSIRMLSLVNASIDDESFLRFLSALSQQSHPLARKLVEFRTVGPSLKVTQSVITMLQLNNRLQYLECGLHPTLFKIYEKRFHDLHYQRIPALPVRTKLAFLSVILSEKEPRTGKRRRFPLLKLSRATATSVFSFLVAPLRREVSVFQIQEEED